MFALTSVWTIREGKEQAAVKALQSLARQAQQHEPGILLYLVHVPDMSLKSLPTPSPLEVIFFEIYKDRATFCAHLSGPIFQGFLKKYVDLFLSTEGECGGGEGATHPYTTAKYLKRKAGFIRQEALGKS
jgi:quinol monooxygenase YgiN